MARRWKAKEKSEEAECENCQAPPITLVRARSRSFALVTLLICVALTRHRMRPWASNTKQKHEYGEKSCMANEQAQPREKEKKKERVKDRERERESE